MPLRRFSIILAGCVALAGCASSPEKAAEASAAQQCNAESMAAVERAALRRNVDVIWVHPPRSGRCMRMTLQL
ncbi:MAG: hypothetical protein H0W33_03180 [Gammaproteobacteria bacterium]|nr:hypothetical protein [Gammaproteobacteria bacterium]